MEKRNETITIAKSIAIILMVIGHSGVAHWMGSFINMFHMPLFFLCSGYCFKDKYLNTPKTFALRRIKGIWVDQPLNKLRCKHSIAYLVV